MWTSGSPQGKGSKPGALTKALPPRDGREGGRPLPPVTPKPKADSSYEPEHAVVADELFQLESFQVPWPGCMGAHICMGRTTDVPSECSQWQVVSRFLTGELRQQFEAAIFRLVRHTVAAGAVPAEHNSNTLLAGTARQRVVGISRTGMSSSSHGAAGVLSHTKRGARRRAGGRHRVARGGAAVACQDRRGARCSGSCCAVTLSPAMPFRAFPRICFGRVRPLPRRAAVRHCALCAASAAVCRPSARLFPMGQGCDACCAFADVRDDARACRKPWASALVLRLV